MTKSARLLLVEDETDILEANAKYLSALGYEIFTATTLKEARNLMWEYPPDLLLLDIMLPDGSGLDFSTEFREYSKAPIIFLTCLDDDNSVLTGFDKGAEDYVVKPYNMKILAARITAQLKRSSRENRLISMPPLIIDRDASSVTLSGEAISFTPKELQLLCYLVDMIGREVSQAELYEAIWGGTSDTMGSAVRTTVSRIRQKLKLSESSHFDLLTTAEGGYVFLRIKYSL